MFGGSTLKLWSGCLRFNTEPSKMMGNVRYVPPNLPVVCSIKHLSGESNSDFPQLVDSERFDV